MQRHWAILLGVLLFVLGIWASPFMYRLAGGTGATERPAPGGARPDPATGSPFLAPLPASTPPGAAAIGAVAGTPLSELYRRLGPSVVNISTLQVVPGRRARYVLDPFTMGLRLDVPEETRESRGSGFVLDAGGLVLTNHHVVRGASQVAVQFADGAVRPARVIGLDERTDLAVLRVEGATGLQPAPLGDSDRVAVGDPVFAIGNPFGLGHSLTTGIVSYRGRLLGREEGPEEFIQTDTAINPGNSGGPLFDMTGRVIGVNTLVQAASQGIGFSIPIHVARRVVPALEKFGRFPRGYLGVVFGRDRPDDGDPGVVVAEVFEGLPAQQAGIRGGDVLVDLGGTAVDDPEAAARALALIPAGTRVPVKLRRDGQERSLDVTLRDRAELAPRPAASTATGVVLEAVDPETLEEVGVPHGVLVKEVRRGSRADGRLRPGDLLLRVDDADASSPEVARELLDRPRRHVVTFVRGRAILRQFV